MLSVGMTYNERKEEGRAYAFFNSEVSRQEIERGTRLAGERFAGLELSLHDVPSFVQTAEPDLTKLIQTKSIYPTYPEACRNQAAFAQPVKVRDLDYVMEARYVGGGNADCADFLGEVMMNALHCRPEHDDKPFTVAIVAKINGEYLFKSEDEHEE